MLYHSDLMQIQGVRLLILGLVLFLICVAGLFCRFVDCCIFLLPKIQGRAITIVCDFIFD